MRVALTRRGLDAKWLLSGALALAGLFGVVAASAQIRLSPSEIENLRRTKPPEEWTIEERLAVRFDPGDIEKRVQAERTQLMENRVSDPVTQAARTAAQSSSYRKSSNAIVGSRNPELFLPTEVFDMFISMAFSPDLDFRRGSRAQFEPGLRAAGLNPDSFWSDLETIAAPTIRGHIGLAELNLQIAPATAKARAGIGKRMTEVYAGLCGPRATDLAKARKYFGARVFDRFLYRTVAPGMFRTTLPGIAMSDQLRAIDGGCHAAIHQ